MGFNVGKDFGQLLAKGVDLILKVTTQINITTKLMYLEGSVAFNILTDKFTIQTNKYTHTSNELFISINSSTNLPTNITIYKDNLELSSDNIKLTTNYVLLTSDSTELDIGDTTINVKSLEISNGTDELIQILIDIATTAEDTDSVTKLEGFLKTT